MTTNKFGARKHTTKKLEVLDKYHGFFPFALSSRFRCIYIDAFAGTGEVLFSDDDAVPALPGFEKSPDIVEGSATRALRATVPYDAYVFIEKSKSKLQTLKKQLEAQFPDRISCCTFICSDANSALRKICATTNWKKSRAVIFLDPFGNQIEWSTLEAIAATKAADVWYLFPSGLGIYRQIPKQGTVQPKAAESITRILGSDGWQYQFTTQTTEVDLFGAPSTKSERSGTVEEITAYAISRLRTIFAGGVLDDFVSLGGKGEVNWYSLLFACSNPETAAKTLAHRVAGWIVGRS